MKNLTSKEREQQFHDFRDRYIGVRAACMSVYSSREYPNVSENTAFLFKLGVAIGTGHAGLIQSSVRNCLEIGIKEDDIEAVFQLSIDAVGIPQASSVYAWIREEMARH
ncbi:MAG: hypothetical protein JAZ17_06310 [Candidatus Thiodiazotropha endolucinida]|nr:hypothetical protein [Candidatus Thiodiazotropha endolucinida]